MAQGPRERVTAAPGQVDLLAWPLLHDAELRAQAADLAWREAVLRARYCPRGARAGREKALGEASQAALAAAVELKRLRRELAR